MTKEEYEDFVLRYKGCGACFPMYINLSRYEKMCLSAIQKDISELEKRNEELTKKVEKYKWNDIFLEDCAEYDKKIAEEYTTLQERIEHLEKENLVLHEMNVKRIDLQKENEELKNQIEKMKCCANCKYQCQFLYQIEDCLKNDLFKWEILEESLND